MCTHPVLRDKCTLSAYEYNMASTRKYMCKYMPAAVHAQHCCWKILTDERLAFCCVRAVAARVRCRERSV